MDRLLAEQQFAQLLRQYQILNQQLRISNSPSEKTELLRKSEKLKREIDMEFRNRLSPVVQKLKILQSEHDKLLVENMENSSEIKRQISIIRQLSEQEETDNSIESKNNCDFLIKTLEQDLENQSINITILQEQIDKFHKNIEYEKRRVLTNTNCVNYYVDYNVIRETLKDEILNSANIVSANTGGQSILNGKKSPQSIFSEFMLSEVKKIKSITTLLNFLLLINLVSSEYKNGRNAVENICKQLFSMLSPEIHALLKKIIKMHVELSALKSKITGLRSNAELIEEAQKEAKASHIGKCLNQCFEPINKNPNRENVNIFPSMEDYNGLLEYFRSSQTSTNKFKQP